LIDVPYLFAGTPHHVGCAVRNVEASIRTYAGTLRLKRHTQPIEVRSQRVCVSFLELTEGFYLELVMPLSPEAKLATYMRVGFYHLCFLVDDLENAATALRARQFSALELRRSPERALPYSAERAHCSDRIPRTM
jgi:catechol 2,3-dioxygenase-like lactoylglutathione lyase family enzyme